MLKKSRRLTSAEVTALLSSGKVVSFGSIRIKYVFWENTHKTSRFSAIASKKVAKEASKRVLLRRRVYAALRSLPAPKKPIHGAIFILKAAPQAILATDLKEALSRLP